MKDVKDSLGQVHRLVPVNVEKQSSCDQCSFGSEDDCMIPDLANTDCFKCTGDTERPSYAYKLVGETVVIG